jgi:hypothetical protein
MRSGTGSRSGAALATTAFVAALGLALLRVTTLSSLGGLRLSAADWALIDFRGSVYYPVRAFVEGANPYNKLAYLARYPGAPEGFPPFLPSTLLIHLPFGFMPLRVAQLWYVGLAIVLVVVLARVALRANGESSWTATIAAAAVIVLSRPGQWSLLVGQVALQATLVSWTALRYATRSPWVSGLALGLATFKPTFGLPLAALMLARGNLKAVGVGALSGFTLNAIPAAILADRSGGFRSYLKSQASAYYAWTGGGSYDVVHSLYRIDLVALAGRVAGRKLAQMERLALTVVVVTVTALLVRRLRRSGTSDYQPLSDAIICIAVLLCVHHLDYDLLLLVFPLVALVYRRVPGLLEAPRVRAVTLGLFAVLALNYVSTQSVLDRFTRQPATVWLLVSINSVVLLLIFTIYAVTALRVTSVEGARGATTPSHVSVGEASQPRVDAIGHG